MVYGRINIFCSEIPFGVDSYRKETSQFMCVPNQLPGFCIVRVSAEGNYRRDFFCVCLFIKIKKKKNNNSNSQKNI